MKRIVALLQKDDNAGCCLDLVGMELDISNIHVPLCVCLIVIGCARKTIKIRVCVCVWSWSVGV